MCERHWIDLSFPIRWSLLETDKARQEIEIAIENAKQNINIICDLAENERNYNSVFHAFEDMTIELDTVWKRIKILENVCNSKEIRNLSTEMTPIVTEFYTSIKLNEKLWNVVKETATNLENQELSSQKKRYIEEVLYSFKKHGADLPEDKKARFSEIMTELHMKSQKYKENLLDSTNAWELYVDDEAKLAGLPKLLIESAKQDAESKGHPDEWRFTLQLPSRLPFMKYSENEELRKKMWEGANSIGLIGEWDNTQLVKEILKLRHEQAQLLGYKDFADYTTEKRMAKTGANALHFVENLHDVIEQQFLKDEEELIAFVTKYTGEKVDYIMPWSKTFWSEKQRIELYDFDEEILRPYFSVDKVLAGLFKIASTLYGITVTEKKTCYRPVGSTEPLPEDAIEVWHPEVKFYDVHDNETQKHIGSFFTDWHPRETKRAGAWMSGILIETIFTGKPHIGMICGNVMKPVGDKPALLNHQEVNTLFHEFGHLCHLLSSECEEKSLGGTNVAWDFVELPSQFLQSWTWEKEALDIFAKHYETNEPIPDDLFEKMVRARNYRSASAFMGQLVLGKIDLEYHINYVKLLDSDKSLYDFEEEVLKGYLIPSPVKRTERAPDLKHLFGSPVGYAAGYYSYKWADILAADAFTRFQNEGIMNSAIGREFRDKILSKGKTIPPDELFRAFMGRDPSPQALLKKIGIYKE